MNKTMKKIYTLFLLLAIVTTFTSAQNMENRRFVITAKAPTFNWLSSSGDIASSAGVNLGYGFGIQMEFPFTDNIFMTGGIHYAGNMGGTVRHRFGGNLWPRARLLNQDLNAGTKPLPDGVELKYRINMMEVPVGLKFYTNYRGNTRYFLELPILGVGILTRSRGDISGPGITTSRDEVIPEETRTFNIFLGGGAGISYDVGFAEVFAGLYYSSTVTNLSQNNGNHAISTSQGNFEVISDNSRLTMQSISLRMGIMF